MKKFFSRLLPVCTFFLQIAQSARAETLQFTEFGDVATIQSLQTLFGNAVRAVVSLAGIALFVMLVIGGYNFLFSTGDQKKLEQARGTITNAVLGLVIIVAGYIIMRVIEIFTGVNVTKFTIPGP